MTDRMATTPFGGGRFSAAIFQAQTRLEEHRKRAQGGNISGKADKWQLLRALTEARGQYALSDRTIAVLEALLSFHPEKELDGLADIIVFPSNTELSLRTRGMSPATLRRHLAALVQGGFVLRRDSPNGKRFARRDGAGQVAEAFGFNLAPFALLAPEIFQKAEETRAHQAAVRKVRGEITLHLRDISKTIEAAFEEGRASVRQGSIWIGFTDRLKALSGRVGRTTAIEDLDLRCEGLVRLRSEVEAAYLEAMTDEELDAEDVAYEARESERYGYSNINMSGNDVSNERHIQNSKTDTTLEYSKEQLNPEPPRSPPAKQRPAESQGERSGSAISLSDLRDACPDFTDYAPRGLTDWADALAGAQLARPMLGISPDAWSRAMRAMGQGGAIVAIAYLIQRATEIKSAGGYLRSLTDKAEAGRFSVRPMLDSLRNRE